MHPSSRDATAERDATTSPVAESKKVIWLDLAGRGRLGDVRLGNLRKTLGGKNSWTLLQAIGTFVTAEDVQVLVAQGKGGQTRSLSRANGLESAYLAFEDDKTWTIRPSPVNSDEPLVLGVYRMVVGTAATRPRRAPGRRGTQQASAEVRARQKRLRDTVRSNTDDAARANVEEALQDTSAWVRETAVHFLARWDDGPTTAFEHMQREDDANVREACLDVIGRHGDEGFIDSLETWSSQFSERDVLKRVDKARKRLAKRFGLERPARLAPRKKR